MGREGAESRFLKLTPLGWDLLETGVSGGLQG